MVVMVVAVGMVMVMVMDLMGIDQEIDLEIDQEIDSEIDWGIDLDNCHTIFDSHLYNHQVPRCKTMPDYVCLSSLSV
jgi:hypothetical protein